MPTPPAGTPSIGSSVLDREQLPEMVRRGSRDALLDMDVSRPDIALVWQVLAAQQELIDQLTDGMSTCKHQRPTIAVAPPVALGLLAAGTRDLVLIWDRELPDDDYEVHLWPSPGLLGAATFAVKARTTTSVVVTEKNTALLAAGGSLAAIAWRNARA